MMRTASENSSHTRPQINSILWEGGREGGRGRREGGGGGREGGRKEEGGSEGGREGGRE